MPTPSAGDQSFWFLCPIAAMTSPRWRGDGLYIVYADGGSVPLDHGVRLDGGAHLEVRCDGLTFSLDDGVFVSGDTVLDVDIFASVTDVVPYIDPDTRYACYSFTPGGGVAFTVHLTETA